MNTIRSFVVLGALLIPGAGRAAEPGGSTPAAAPAPTCASPRRPLDTDVYAAEQAHRRELPKRQLDWNVFARLTPKRALATESPWLDHAPAAEGKQAEAIASSSTFSSGY